MAEFQQHGIVPDSIPAPPRAIAKIDYGNAHNVNLGNVLSISSTQTQPTIMAAGSKGVYHTVMMIDPDALSRSVHEFRHFLHWLVVNVEGTGGGALDCSKGTSHTVCSYMGPAPPPGTGYHRYICLIYQQHMKADTGRIKPIAKDKMQERKSFNPQTWLSQNFAGSPPVLVAGNFFLAGTADESLANKSEQQMKNEAEMKGGSAKDKAGVGKDKGDKGDKGNKDQSKQHDHDKDEKKK